MLAGNILQASYSFINAAWVGKGLGKDALAAISNSFPPVFVLIAIAIGVTTASNILAAQYYGSRQWERLREVVSTSFILIFVMSVLLVIIGEFASRNLLLLMQTPPAVLDLATGYLRIFLLALPLAFGMFLQASLLRGIGDTVTPLRFLIVSVVINAVLDPLLMFGWLHFPRLGLNGAAVASIIAQGCAYLALAAHLRRTHSPIAPTWRQLRFDIPTGWMILRIGMPSAIQQGLVSIGMVVVIGLVNHFGENVTAAYGAASRIDQLAFFPAMSLGVAVTSLAGQNIGAQRFDRVRVLFWWGVLISVSITLLASLAAVGIPGLLLSIFVKSNETAVFAIGISYLHIVGFSYLFFAVMFVSSGIINGAGHTFFTTIISLVSVWIVRVALAEYLSRRTGSEVGIWYAMAISYSVAMVLSLAYYFSGRWKRMIIHKPPVELPGAPVPEEDTSVLDQCSPLDMPEKCE